MCMRFFKISVFNGCNLSPARVVFNPKKIIYRQPEIRSKPELEFLKPELEMKENKSLFQYNF